MAGRAARRPPPDGRDGRLQTAHSTQPRCCARPFVLASETGWPTSHRRLAPLHRGRTFVHVDIEPNPGSAGSSLLTTGLVLRRRCGAAAVREWARASLAGGSRTVPPGAAVPAIAARPCSCSPTSTTCRSSLSGSTRDEPRVRPGTRTSARSALSQIAASQFLHVYRPRTGSTRAQAGPWAGPPRPRSAVCVADPDRRWWLCPVDYSSSQIEVDKNAAVGAQFNLPYIHVLGYLGNNAYLGCIRQSQSRLRHGLLRAACLRQRSTRPSSAATASTTVKVAEGSAARRCGDRPGRDRARARGGKKLMADTGCRWCRVILGRSGHQPISIGDRLDNHGGVRGLPNGVRTAPTAVVADALLTIEIVVAPDSSALVRMIARDRASRA